MKLSKKLTTLAIVGAMSATAAVASAANIGLVNMSQVVNSYPGYGALDMKMQQVDAQYRPQIEKKVQEIEKIKDSAQAEAEFNKTVAPLLQKENEEINKIAQPMMQAIHNTVEAIRVEKQMDVVLDDPYTIRAADANSKIENITNEVISKQYASFVNDGHRMDRHFVPGLVINPGSGLLEFNPDGTGGIVVGTRTAYVPGLFMVDKAVEEYRRVLREELKGLEELMG